MGKLADVLALLLQLIFSPYMLMGVGSAMLSVACKLPWWAGTGMYFMGSALLLRMGHGQR